MPNFHSLIFFALAALVMALTPGPNMIYLISRSLCQGINAGIISLIGIIFAFMFHILAVASGLTAIFLSIPFALKAVKIGGATYLLWLAWRAISKSMPLFVQDKLPGDSFLELLQTGFMTNFLNPKAIIFYMALFPQFIDLKSNTIFYQSLLLGFTQITISFVINLLVIVTASTIYKFFECDLKWQKLQKWIMGIVLCGLALKLIF